MAQQNKLIFRLDAGPNVGLGHLFRCISIANYIKKSQATFFVKFLINNNEYAINELRNNNISYSLVYNVSEEEAILNALCREKADAIFIDNLFPYTKTFIKSVNNLVKVIMFHNYCEGSFESDLCIYPIGHLNENILNDKRWNENKVRMYAGLRYVVLNENILSIKRKTSIKTDPTKIILSTGGSDPNGVMLKLISYFDGIKIPNLEITALIGKVFKKRRELERLMHSYSGILKISPFNYDEFASADLAINTFGVSTYELIYLGIPVLTVGHKEQNAKGSFILANKYGFTFDLGLIDNLSKEKLITTIRDMTSNTNTLIDMQSKSFGVIDGNGVKRISSLVCNLITKRD